MPPASLPLAGPFVAAQRVPVFRSPLKQRAFFTTRGSAAFSQFSCFCLAVLPLNNSEIASRLLIFYGRFSYNQAASLAAGFPPSNSPLSLAYQAKDEGV